MTDGDICERYRTLIDETAGRPPEGGDGPLEAHLAGCEGCRAYARAMDGLSRFSLALDEREAEAAPVASSVDVRSVAIEAARRAAQAGSAPLVRPGDFPVFAALAVASALALLAFVLDGGAHAGILVKTIIVGLGVARDLAGTALNPSDPGTFSVYAAGLAIVVLLLATPELLRRFGRGWR